MQRETYGAGRENTGSAGADGGNGAVHADDRDTHASEVASPTEPTASTAPAPTENRGSSELTLHGYARSGHCYKVRLTAAHLGIRLNRVQHDIMRGETRTVSYLSGINANGRIPVLQIGERFLPESNAACVWLAHGSALIPADRFDHADMLRWMFWEQYSHEPNVVALRFWRTFVGEDALTELQRAQIPLKEAAGEAALALMDDHLSSRDWFAGGAFSLADVALYAYTHVAGEGGLDLAPHPAVVRWLARVAALPRHIGMDD